MPGRAGARLKMYHWPDVMRLKLLLEHGGIFVDHDAFVVRSLDDFRQCAAAPVMAGFEQISARAVVPSSTPACCSRRPTPRCCGCSSPRGGATTRPRGTGTAARARTPSTWPAPASRRCAQTSAIIAVYPLPLPSWRCTPAPASRSARRPRPAAALPHKARVPSAPAAHAGRARDGPEPQVAAAGAASVRLTTRSARHAHRPDCGKRLADGGRIGLSAAGMRRARGRIRGSCVLSQGCLPLVRRFSLIVVWTIHGNFE